MKILTTTSAAQRAEWDAFIAALPPDKQDVHFACAWARVHEETGGKAFLVVLDNIVMPFIKRPIRQAAGYFDLFSMGYGGPVGPDDAKSDFESFYAWCKKQNIVSLFCYLHPLFPYHHAGLQNGIVREVVVMNLNNLDESSFSRRVRRALKKTDTAISHRTNGGEWQEEFSALYRDSMMRKSAPAHWRLTGAYFERFFDHIDCDLFVLRVAEGTRMLLTCGRGHIAYAHLLASDGNGKQAGLDEALYVAAARQLKAFGVNQFHLGGGMTNKSDDSLLAFKSGFSDIRYKMHRWTRVINQPIYNELATRKIMEEINEHGKPLESDFFPIYRRTA